MTETFRTIETASYAAVTPPSTFGLWREAASAAARVRGSSTPLQFEASLTEGLAAVFAKGRVPA